MSEAAQTKPDSILETVVHLLLLKPHSASLACGHIVECLYPDGMVVYAAMILWKEPKWRVTESRCYVTCEECLK
jgi:hypothetical protein